MQLDLDLLKKQLNRFADECKLTPEKIGILADESASLDDFKISLDKLCRSRVGKTSLEILAGINVRLPDMKNYPNSSEPQISENSPIQNELIEVEQKIDNLKQRDKSGKIQTNL